MVIKKMSKNRHLKVFACHTLSTTNHVLSDLLAAGGKTPDTVKDGDDRFDLMESKHK